MREGEAKGHRETGKAAIVMHRSQETCLNKGLEDDGKVLD
jgi:hypothetical protein